MLPNSYVQSMYMGPNQQNAAPLPFGYSSTTQPQKPVFQPQPPQFEPEYQVQPIQQPIQQPVEQMQIQQPQQIKTVVINKQQKFSYFIDWLLYALPIAFFILILIVMTMLFTAKVKHFNPESAHNTLETLKQNMQHDPIEDIVLATNNESHILDLISHYRDDSQTCPDGYQLMSLGQWDGVESGCICENGQISHSATCFYKSNCKRVQSHESKQFTVWQQKQYCQKKYSDWEILTGATCQNNYKQCGNICVPINKNCPLSGLQSTNDLNVNTNTNKIQIGQNHYIKKYENSSPIINLEIVPGLGQSQSSPCYNHKLNPKFQSSKYYPLAKRPEIGCDKYLDLEQHRITLNTFSAHQIYQQNDLTNTLNNLPYYSNYEDNQDTYALEAIKKIQINTLPECQKLTPKEVDTISKSGQRVYNSERSFSLIIIFSVGFILFVVPILYLMRNRIFSWVDMNDFHQPKFLCGIGIIIALICIALASVYFSEVDGNNGLKQHNAQFQTYLEKNCFPDEGLKLAITQVNDFAKNTYYTTYSFVMAAFYISITYLILLIIFLIFQYFTHKSLFDNPWINRELKHQEFE